MGGGSSTENCWEFFDCKTKIECPAYKTESGGECWLIAGTFSESPSCPKIVYEYRACWECPFYKKKNPDEQMQ